MQRRFPLKIGELVGLHVNNVLKLEFWRKVLRKVKNQLQNNVFFYEFSKNWFLMFVPAARENSSPSSVVHISLLLTPAEST